MPYFFRFVFKLASDFVRLVSDYTAAPAPSLPNPPPPPPPPIGRCCMIGYKLNSSDSIGVDEALYPIATAHCPIFSCRSQRKHWRDESPSLRGHHATTKTVLSRRGDQPNYFWRRDQAYKRYMVPRSIYNTGLFYKSQYYIDSDQIFTLPGV